MFPGSISIAIFGAGMIVRDSDKMRTVFEGALTRTAAGARVKVCFVHHPDLKVPDFVRPSETEFTVFEYGFNMPFSMSDLEVDDKGISAVLFFSRIPHITFVPWEAIVGIRTHEEVESISSHKPTLVLVP